MICNPHQILLGLSNQDECDEQGMWHIWRRGVYRVLVGKPDGKRPLCRPRLRWKKSIKMDLQEVLWEAWTRLILV